jgi:hypothetical protein
MSLSLSTLKYFSIGSPLNNFDKGVYTLGLKKVFVRR